jgi:KDO2-lipid IV(A) lauroyltransferase
MRRLKPSLALSLTRRLAPLQLLRKKRLCRANLKSFFGSDWPRAAEAGWRAAHLDYLARLSADGPRHAFITPEQMKQEASFSGEEHLTEALRRGRGVLLLSGHFGNWYVAPFLLAAHGYPVTIVFRSPPVRLGPGSLIMRLAARFNVRFAFIGQNAVPAVGATLRNNSILYVVGDAVVADSSPAWYPFGHTTMRMNRGPMILARRYGAAVLHARCELISDERSRVIVRPFLDDVPNPRSLSPDELCRRWLDVLYREVQERPDQWWLWSRQRLRGPAETV